MRIGFLSDSYNDPERIGSWSGLPYHFAQKMRQNGCEIVPIRGSDAIGSLSEKIKQAAWKLVGRRYVRGLCHDALRAYAASVVEPISRGRVDVIFSVNSWLLAYLDTELPTVFWTDATFASMLGFYDSFSRLAPVSLRTGHEIEQRVLDRCSLAVYSSSWAATSAERDYRLDPSRLLVLPFGANLDPTPDRDAVEAFVQAKSRSDRRETCELLCIGVDWRRKGIDVVVAVSRALTARGIKNRLRIAGCHPPRGAALPPNVEIVGFLDKNSPEGQKRLHDLYRESHFFLLPSRAEAFGIVLSEACSFGVPCLGTNVGGVTDVIRPGINGQRFPLDTPADAYAEWIETLWKDPDKYQRFALATYEDYLARLDGHKAVEKLVERMRLLAACPAVLAGT